MLVALLHGKAIAFKVMPFFIPMQSPFSGGGGSSNHPTEAAKNGSLVKFQTPSWLRFPATAIMSGPKSKTVGHYDKVLIFDCNK